MVLQAVQTHRRPLRGLIRAAFAVTGGALLLAACARHAVPPPARQAVAVTAPGPAPATAVPAKTAPPSWRLCAVGDIMLGGRAEGLLRQRGYDHPFAATAHILSACDVALGNLEGPITERGRPAPDKRFVFRMHPDVAPVLARAGFDVLTLANNHILDYGVEGLVDTLESLARHGLRAHGAGMNLAEARRPALFEVSGLKIGFLAYSNTFPDAFWARADRPGTAFGDPAHVREDIAALRASGVDAVIVSFHWGRELHDEPRDYQIALAHAAIDAGAAAVIGHHPHVLQGVERYRDGLILYSLGNFAFGSYSTRVRDSVLAVLDFDGGRVTGLRLYPLNVDNFEVHFQPRPLAGAAAARVCAALRALSDGRGLTLNCADDMILWSVAPPAPGVDSASPSGPESP